MRILKFPAAVLAGAVLALVCGLWSAAFGMDPGDRETVPAGVLICLDEAAAVAVAEAAEVDAVVSQAETRLAMAQGLCVPSGGPLPVIMSARVRVYQDWRGFTGVVWRAAIPGKGVDVWLLRRAAGLDL